MPSTLEDLDAVRARTEAFARLAAAVLFDRFVTSLHAAARGRSEQRNDAFEESVHDGSDGSEHAA